MPTRWRGRPASPFGALPHGRTAPPPVRACNEVADWGPPARVIARGETARKLPASVYRCKGVVHTAEEARPTDHPSGCWQARGHRRRGRLERPTTPHPDNRRRRTRWSGWTRSAGGSRRMPRFSSPSSQTAPPVLMGRGRPTTGLHARSIASRAEVAPRALRARREGWRRGEHGM